MRKIILIFVLMLTGICYALENNTQFPEVAFKSVSAYNIGTGREYNITPVGSTEVYASAQTTKDVYRPRKVEHPQDPFADPIGDVPAIAFICFICFYLLSKKNKQMVDD